MAGKLGEFDVASGNWASYCERLEMYFLVNATKDDLKVPTLISLVGEATYELMVNLCSPDKPKNKTFKDLVRVMADHLQPKPSILAERYRFRQCRQKSNESVASYEANLKKLAKHCDFGPMLSENIRDQFVCGIFSDVIRQRLFAEGTIGLQAAVNLAITIEAAERNASAVDVNSPNQNGGGGGGGAGDARYQSARGAASRDLEHIMGAVHKVYLGECTACGDSKHTWRECQYRTFVCSRCRRTGHLRRMCPTELEGERQWDTEYAGNRGRIRFPPGQPRGDGVERGGASQRGGAGSRRRGGARWRPSRGYGAAGSSTRRSATYNLQEERAEEADQNLHGHDEEQVFQMSLTDYKPKLSVSGRPEIWEGSEFILSCTAYGSTEMSFMWYKDGARVNFNATTRNIWTRLIAEEEPEKFTSVVSVSDARGLDSGRWSCVAQDASRRRCRALWLTVIASPEIRLEPTTLTVNKGDNVSITCLTAARQDLGVLGFSWARDRTLLRLAPAREAWEDLYPAGSVLKLYNVQKSAEFQCQVSSMAGTNTRGVTLWVLGAGGEACEASVSHGVSWPWTAPGAHASAPCPTNYSGEIQRFCEPKTIHRGVKWKSPDFSRCIAISLLKSYEQFQLISHGYSWSNLTDVIRRYERTLRSLRTYPGEGTIPLEHTREMLSYLLSIAGKSNDRAESVEHLLRVFDTLLKHPDNFLDEEKVFQLQHALVQAASIKDNLEDTLNEFTVMTKSVLGYNTASFNLHSLNSHKENWSVTSAGVELARSSRSSVVVAVRYNNLAARLPSLKSSIELRNGAEIEYLIASQHIQIAANGLAANPSLPHTVTLLFTQTQNYSTFVSKLACGLRSPEEPRVWSTEVCEVRIPEPTNVACQCRGLGTFALFTVARSTLTHTEKDLRGAVRVTVGVGGALCLAATALQMLGLLPSRNDRLPVLLKAATAGTHSAAMFTLLECDNQQEEACAGALGWVCAACWCAGCAALCAQPLLLQTQLHSPRHHAPAVSLLAGLCTLAWLTARLWGGAPLQLGTSAQVVCAGACALLTLLCLALAVCAALRLRTATRKVPAERIKFFKSRRRIVRHTLVLLLTTTAAQAAGVAYAQPGERRSAHVIALAGAAIANGVAMVVCYVFRDEQCLLNVRRALSLAPPRDWQENQGDTSLSLYIKQGDEVESRGGAGVMESSPTRLSPAESYWQASALDSPEKIHHRRKSEPDCRADIVQCVEYARWGAGAVVTRAVCDLVPRAPACALCARSSPDVSREPVKSCLKKPCSPQLERVNREWNKAYEPPADKVLHEISSDLDFLLNRTLDSKVILDEIEEAPT